MNSDNDSRMMTFLCKRTCLILVTAEGKQKVGTYIPDDNVTILGRGTGVLIEYNGNSFIATNDHVVHMHRREDICTTVHIGLENKKPFAEQHGEFAYAGREFMDGEDGYAALDVLGHPIPKDPLNDTDLALVRLLPSSGRAARADGREFVVWPITPNQAPSVNDRVCFRGYPKENVDFIPERRAFGVDGYSLFTSVLRTEGNRIVADARESAISFGNGRVQLNRDLHGISGSGLFDIDGKLLGIVYGGNPDAKEIFACNACELAPLFDQFK